MLFLFTPHQCCGSASNKNQDPDPHQSDKLDPEPYQDPHQFADDKPKCIEQGAYLSTFQGFDVLFGG
jgi:hypothetical protein